MTLVRPLALVSAVAMAFASLQPASAQVPPFKLTCTATGTASAAGITVGPGSTIKVDCTLVDAATGAPRDETNELTYTINYDTGTNSGYEGGGKTKLVKPDRDGKASANLRIGDKSGNLGILVTYYGTRSSFFAVRVEGTALPPAPVAAPVAPATAPVVPAVVPPVVPQLPPNFPPIDPSLLDGLEGYFLP